MINSRLIKRIWRAVPLTDYMRWQITIIVLKPILPFIGGSIIHTSFLKEQEWQTKRIKPFYGDPLPELPQQETQDIFIWGIIDWRFRYQRPQHLATGFASRGHRVFYISTSFVNAGLKKGFEIEQLDTKGHLFNIRLYLGQRPALYASAPNPKTIRKLKQDIALLLQWSKSNEILSVVQHPFWYDLAKSLPQSRLIYDCMDHHVGFGDLDNSLINSEQLLFKYAEAVIVSSDGLYNTALSYNSKTFVIRNGADYEFFAKRPPIHYKPAQEFKQVIGYYGAIAHWIDLDILEAIADYFPACELLLVGADECGARQRLAGKKNVRFTGEVEYSQLPFYLHGFDVCILPFQLIPLTQATNPVKVYEYLAAGKPVVSVNLPEARQFDKLIAITDTTIEFLSAVQHALNNPGIRADIDQRQSFARENTWSTRVDSFLDIFATLSDPPISIIVVTYNNLHLTQACLDSIKSHTDGHEIEVIVVDNGSTDGTRQFLGKWAASNSISRIILNDENKGFAAANNQGLAIAKGDYLVILNNDTEVSPGWIRTFLQHFRHDPSLGLIGPVTNNIGNEAKINLHYKTPAEMWEKAKKYTLNHMGERLPIHVLAFFCVMMPRHVYEKVGLLDEAFGLGFFEDDDYCRRIEQAGWHLACVEDVFIYHHLSASFSKLGHGRKLLLEKNRKLYEEKWGAWIPHKHR